MSVFVTGFQFVLPFNPFCVQLRRAGWRVGKIKWHAIEQANVRKQQLYVQSAVKCTYMLNKKPNTISILLELDLYG